MKHKANSLLSFILACVWMVGILPISVFATWERYDVDYTTGIVVDWMPDESVDLSGYYADVSALNLSEALDAYKAFTEEEYHEDVWLYTIESFGLMTMRVITRTREGLMFSQILWVKTSTKGLVQKTLPHSRTVLKVIPL